MLESLSFSAMPFKMPTIRADSPFVAFSDCFENEVEDIVILFLVPELALFRETHSSAAVTYSRISHVLPGPI